MSKAYIDKGVNEGETVYSINLLTEEELSIIASSVESFMNALEELCYKNLEEPELNVYAHKRFVDTVALYHKLKP